MVNKKEHIENALFICNEKFLDASFPEGGVKFCTDEFIALIKIRFRISFFPVSYSKKIGYRLKKKIGITAYEDYDVDSYEAKLKEVISEKRISHVFLNLSNTAPFAGLIREFSPAIKIILCSHGNESGDFLHEIVAHEKFTGSKKKTAQYSLGKMLVKESEQRKFIDLVLTVSDIEVNIEKWLGTKNVYMVPRTIAKNESAGIQIAGRVGFLSDLSHEPNFYGISKLCEAIATFGNKADKTEIRLAGGGKERAAVLEKKYPFVKYLGHLTQNELEEEAGRWAYGLNPVFYYSRGVSTKLGKLLGMGIAVISSQIGLRGYQWSEGAIPIVTDAEQMAYFITHDSVDLNKAISFRKEVSKIQNSSKVLPDIMSDLSTFI